MELLLVRHAEAEAVEVSGSDQARALSPAGVDAVRCAARGLERLGLHLERLYHSPLLRARQTAELLEPLLDGERTALDELAVPPGRALLDRLRGMRTAAVGHAPYIDELCAWLTTGEREAARGLPFRKGAIAYLEGRPSPGGMVLRAHLSPDVLRTLSR